jgi:transposase-like protein
MSVLMRDWRRQIQEEVHIHPGQSSRKTDMSPDGLPKSQFQLTPWWRRGGERLGEEKEMGQ